MIPFLWELTLILTILMILLAVPIIRIVDLPGIPKNIPIRNPAFWNVFDGGFIVIHQVKRPEFNGCPNLVKIKNLKWTEELCYHEECVGKRVKRGLFQSQNGQYLNADVNGALNIIRKSKQNFGLTEELCSGLMFSPKRIIVI
jgi:hypothetical protein